MECVRRAMAIAAGCGTRGGVLVMTLVFVSMFLVIFIGLAGMVNRTFRETVLQKQDELAFQIAESGLDYGRWRLAHNSEYFETETKEVVDQFAGTLGEFEVSFSPQADSTVVEIESVGQTANQPTRQITLRARYGIPSLARYASVTNTDVWYGGQINGPVHSNGGIRMDGQSESLMTSEKETYICQPHHGCSYVEQPGIWGSGTTEELWEFPAPRVDYAGLTLDLLDLQDIAEDTGTAYGDSSAFGYHIVFNSDNTYSIFQVTGKTSPVYSWLPNEKVCNKGVCYCNDVYTLTSHDIANETLIETRAVPSGGVIYAEDMVWVEGDIRDRVTVAAGVFPDNPSTYVDVMLNGDISYGGVTDGSRVFGLISQRHVLIPYSGAEDNLELDGAFIAQNGIFGRRYYPSACGSGAHTLKSSLVRYGMIASNLVPVTAWVNGGGTVVSGYQSGSATYDPNLLYGPPPHFPTSGQYQFLSWEEQQ